MATTYGVAPVRREMRNWITDHAMQRFRERTGAIELRTLPDADIARIVDECVTSSSRSTDVDDLSDGPEHPQRTTVVAFEDRTGRELHAVLRDPGANPLHLRPRGVGPREPHRVVITILTATMAEMAFAVGRWRQVGAPPLTVPLADQLRRRVVVPTAPSPAPSAPIATSDAPGKLADGTLHDEVNVRRLAVQTQEARHARAREILRAEPDISLSGEGGLSDRIEAEFGVGLVWATMTRLRAEVTGTQPKASSPAVAPHVPATQPPTQPPTRSLGEQLTTAIAAEQAAKAAVVEIQRRLAEATAEVDRLMAEVAASRR